jgi:hypothetical protein
MGTLTYPDFDKKKFSHNQKETSTTIYHLIENFTGYRMVYKKLKENVTMCPFLKDRVIRRLKSA